MNIDQNYNWGLYKPYLIYSITEKSVHPLTLRFAYSKLEGKSNWWPIQYSMDQALQAGDLLKANYLYHNGIDFSIQNIQDLQLNLDFDLTFIKNNSANQNYIWFTFFQYNSTKELNIKNQENLKMVLFYSIGFESNDITKDPDDRVIQLNLTNYQIKLYSKRQQKEIGNFKIQFYQEQTELNIQENNKNINVQFYDGSKIMNEQQAWNILLDLYLIKDNAKQQIIKEYLEIKTLIIKIEFNIQLSMAINIIYTDKQSSIENMQYDEIQTIIKNKKQEFNIKFGQIFNVTSNINQLSKISFSNLIGGLIYSYGMLSTSESESKISPSHLFTLTPSRTKFARSFLWDDGFHLILICKWDIYLCTQIIDSWFSSQFSNGWIPREQARGEEVLFYSQTQFIEQDTSNSNPPSIMLPILEMLQKIKNNNYNENENQYITQFFENIYLKIYKYYIWFYNNYLIIKVKQLSYFKPVENKDLFFKWHSKTDYNNIPLMYYDSGLDDYPRFIDQDLHSWMILFTEVLIQLTEQVTPFNQNFILQLNQTLKDLFINLNEFYDQDNKIYKDFGYFANQSKFFSSHIGYENLFPLLFNQLKLSNEIQFQIYTNLIQILSDESQLYSQYGIRSLSKQSSKYHALTNYWRGYIWININYLIIHSLVNYYLPQLQNQNLQLYKMTKTLVQNLIQGIYKNIDKEFNKKGFFFENYDDVTGQGRGQHPFNGWTSLYTLIISYYPNNEISSLRKCIVKISLTKFKIQSHFYLILFAMLKLLQI